MTASQAHRLHLQRLDCSPLVAQDSDNAADTEFAVSVGGSIGPVDLTLAHADNGTAGDHTVLAGRFDVGAATNIEVYFADADQLR